MTDDGLDELVARPKRTYRRKSVEVIETFAEVPAEVMDRDPLHELGIDGLAATWRPDGGPEMNRWDGGLSPEILARFRRAYPNVELSVIEDTGEYLQHLLIGGELDVAVLLTSSVRDRLALHVETLLVSPYRLWLPLGHRLAEQEAIELSELAGEPLIQLMVDEIEESTRALMSAMARRPEISFRTRSVEEVREINRLMREDTWPDVEAGRIALPIDRTYPLEKAAEALAHMKAHTHLGKIVLEA